jgi:hypothetical protein
MKAIIAIIVATALVVTPSLTEAQQALSADAEATAFKQLAAGIPLGSLVRLQVRSGRRLTATLMAVEDQGIVVKRASRVPEPAVVVRFDELTHLQREVKSGFSVAKALGIGLAAGVGAILTLFAIAVSIDD